MKELPKNMSEIDPANIAGATQEGAEGKKKTSKKSKKDEIKEEDETAPKEKKKKE